MAEPSIQVQAEDQAASHFVSAALPPPVDLGPQKPRSRWRRLRLLLGILMLATGAGTAYYFYASAIAEKRLEKAIAEADRLEPGWRLDDILRKQPRIADKDNGAFQRIAVEQMLVGWRLPRATKSVPQIQLTEEQTANLRANLEGAAAALEAARQLAHAPEGSQPFTWTPKGFASSFPPPVRALDVGKLLSMDAMLLAQDGKLDQALASCRAILGAARTLGDGPDLMTCLVRTALDAIAVTTLGRVLAQGEASETALADLQKVLEQEAAQPLYLNAFRGERASTDRMLDAISKGEMKITDLFPPTSPTWLRLGGVGPQEVFNMVRVGSITNARATYLEFTTRLIETAKLPERNRGAQLKVLLEQLKDQPWLVRRRLTMHGKYQVDSDLDHVQLRHAIAAIAAERYRLVHRHWPDSLESLVPRYLAQVPDDPFVDGPLRLQRLDHRLFITGNGKRTRFGLWDVESRRQVPQREDGI